MVTQKQQEIIDEFFNEKSKLLYPLARYMAEQNIHMSFENYFVKQKKLDFLNEEFNNLNSEWVFAGYKDYKYFGAGCCSLGHPLRYGYFAKNKKTGEVIQFGIKCLSDFFEVKEEVMKALNKLARELQEEQKSYEDLLILEPPSYLLEFLKSSECNLPLRPYYIKLLMNGLPLPKSDLLLIKPLYESFKLRHKEVNNLKWLFSRGIKVNSDIRQIYANMPSDIKYYKLFGKVISFLNSCNPEELSDSDIRSLTGMDLNMFGEAINYIFSYPADKIPALGDEGVEFLNSYFIQMTNRVYTKDDYIKTLNIHKRLLERYSKDKGGLLGLYLAGKFSNIAELN